MDVFCDDEDRRTFLEILEHLAPKNQITVHAWCLMSNHIHLIVTPATQEGMGRLFRDVNGRYARYFNRKTGGSGALWQSRFYSCVMDDTHVFRAIRYVLMNPVEAGLVRKSVEYPWSSAGFQFALREKDPLVKQPLDRKSLEALQSLSRLNWEKEKKQQETCIQSGLPYGDDAFINRLEKETGRKLRYQKPGPKPRNKGILFEFPPLFLPGQLTEPFPAPLGQSLIPSATLNQPPRKPVL